MAGLALTFDDAYVDEWVAAIPLFARYGARATFFVSYFPVLDVRAVSAMHRLASAGHEIGFHSVSHKNAVEMAAAAGLDRYEAEEILPGLEAMRFFGFSPASFAYPFNARTPELDTVLLKHFRCVRGRAFEAEEALHAPTGNRLLRAKGCDQILGNGDPLRSTEEIVGYVDVAAAADRVIALYGHGISETPVPHHRMTVSGLDALLARAAEKGLSFLTASELA